MTAFDVQELRRQGPVWRLVVAVDGVDELVEGFLPGKLCRTLAVVIYRWHVALQYHVKPSQVYLNLAERTG